MNIAWRTPGYVLQRHPLTADLSCWRESMTMGSRDQQPINSPMRIRLLKFGVNVPENKPDNTPTEIKAGEKTNVNAASMTQAARAKVRWMIGFAVFVVVLAGLWWLLKQKYDANTTPESYGFVAKFEKDGIPAIEAVDLTGKPFDLAKIETPVVIVNFWASWCGPCVEEFPSMLKLVDALDGKVTIVAVSMDDDEKDLRAFAKLFKVPRKGFEVLWDKDKKVMNTYAVGKLPESYIVGPDRKLIRKVLGIEDWATANAIEYFKSLADKNHPAK